MWGGGKRVALGNRVITIGLTEKVASDQRTEEGEGTSHGDIREWSIPGGGTPTQRPRGRMGLVCPRTR